MISVSTQNIYAIERSTLTSKQLEPRGIVTRSLSRADAVNGLAKPAVYDICVRDRLGPRVSLMAAAPFCTMISKIHSYCTAGSREKQFRRLQSLFLKVRYTV
jgi:hypothetical protein